MTQSVTRFTRQLSYVLFAAALMATASFTHAEEPKAEAPAAATAPHGMSPEQAKQIEQFQALQNEARELQQQLGAIHEATLKANPELQQQRDDLEALIGGKMREAGSDPDKDMEKIQGLQAKMQDQNLPEAEREQHFREFSKTVESFQAAQEKVMQDKDVQAAQEKMENDTMAAMMKQDANTEKLIAQVREKQEAMMAIRDQLMPPAAAK